jgi:hypothetical protein
MRGTLLALVALATVVAGTATIAGPAQAADDIVTIDLKRQGDVSLGEVQKIVDATLKSPTGAAEAVAVAADTGAVPTAKQAQALLAGKSVDGMTVYRTVGKVSAANTVSGFVEGTPLPAFVAYLKMSEVTGLTHVVVIVCADYCRIYVREYVLS